MHQPLGDPGCGQSRWELYYPPFESGIDAGAVAFMCSYNKAQTKSPGANLDV